LAPLCDLLRAVDTLASQIDAAKGELEVAQMLVGLEGGLGQVSTFLSLETALGSLRR